MKDGLRFVDCDMHIMEPPDLFERYLDPRFRERVSPLRLQLPPRVHEPLEERFPRDRGADLPGGRAALRVHGRRLREGGRRRGHAERWPMMMTAAGPATVISGHEGGRR